jgi:hypothetical protein
MPTVFAIFTCLLTVAVGVAPSLYADENVPASPRTFTVLCIPGLTWPDLENPTHPNLQGIAGQGAIANLVSDGDNRAAELIAEPYVEFAILDGGVDAADARLGDFVANMKPGETLIVVSAPMYYGVLGDRSLTPLIIYGGELRGLISTSTTQRAGLVSASDIVTHVQEVCGTPSQAPAPVYFNVTAPASQLEANIGLLYDDAALCAAVAATKLPMNITALVLFLLTAAVSTLLLFFEIGIKTRYIETLIALSRILWIILLSLLLGSYLMFITPDLFSPGDAATSLSVVLDCVFWAGLVAVAAVLVGFLSKRWINALLLLFVLAFCTILGNLLLGGPLTFTGYLNYGVNEGVRYYGLGNEAAAVLFGSWVTFCGVIINRYPTARFVEPFKRWGFLLASALIIAISVWPSFGASFGVLVWGFIGVIIAWWLMNERRITARLLIGVVAVAAVLAIAILSVDLLFNTGSHMDHLLARFNEGFGPLVMQILADIGEYSIATLTFSPPLTVAFIIVFLLLVVLAWLKPGTYLEFWAHNRGFRAVYAAGLWTMLVMCVIEDSGIFMPTIYSIYMLAGFVWLVCDLHSWHAREIEAGGDAELTLRELLIRALEEKRHAQ